MSSFAHQRIKELLIWMQVLLALFALIARHNFYIEIGFKLLHTCLVMKNLISKDSEISKLGSDLFFEHWIVIVGGCA